jgi:hypothetical protein
MDELNWVKELKESYLKEISFNNNVLGVGNNNMSLYMSSLKGKLVSHVPNSEKHVDSFVKEHILPHMTDLHNARIHGASDSSIIDAFSSHTADNHKHKFFQYVIGQSGDEPNDEPKVDHEAHEGGFQNPDEDRDEIPRD